MDLFTLRQVLLVVHLTGLVLMAGTTVSEFVAFRWFVNLLKAHDKASVGLFRLLSGLGPVLLTGGALLVVSGIGLVVLTGGVYWQQFWLQVKLMLILILPLNGLLVGAPLMKQLKNCPFAKGGGLRLPSQLAINRLTWFHSVQLLVLLTIVILAIFKFT